jgi:hypothetical protein
VNVYREKFLDLSFDGIENAIAVERNRRYASIPHQPHADTGWIWEPKKAETNWGNSDRS